MTRKTGDLANEKFGGAQKGNGERGGVARGVVARPHRYAKRCGREWWSVGVVE
jgi:hypothetical protein